MSVARGQGPVNALDIALRKDLGKYQAEIEDMDPIDLRSASSTAAPRPSPAS